jgi:hypothetical protein
MLPNFQRRKSDIFQRWKFDIFQQMTSDNYTGYAYGWPRGFIWVWRPDIIDEYGLLLDIKREPLVYWKAFAIDIGMWLSALAFVAFISEWLIRRREGRKP